MIAAFQPRHAATVLIDSSSSSQRVLVSSDVPASIRIMNNGTATVWVEFGDSAVTSSLTSGFPVGPGVTEVVRGSFKGAAPATPDLYVAVIAAGATGKIYFTPGVGV
jgi:hypothetical protein